MSSNITTLFAQLSSLPPSLSALLDFHTLSLFVDLFAAIKPSLSWYQCLDRGAPPLPAVGPPAMLSRSLQEFFAAALGISPHHFPLLWTILGEWLWYTCPTRCELSSEVLEAFRLHGLHRGIGTLLSVSACCYYHLHVNQLRSISAHRVVHASTQNVAISGELLLAPLVYLPIPGLSWPCTSLVNLALSPQCPIR